MSELLVGVALQVQLSLLVCRVVQRLMTFSKTQPNDRGAS
jgi:hypothetical protein